MTFIIVKKFSPHANGGGGFVPYAFISFLWPKEFNDAYVASLKVSDCF
jgi:hypothetical protein